MIGSLHNQWRLGGMSYGVVARLEERLAHRGLEMVSLSVLTSGFVLERCLFQCCFIVVLAFRGSDYVMFGAVLAPNVTYHGVEISVANVTYHSSVGYF